MTPARSENGGSRGYIIPIGGAEEKLRDRTILRRFVDLAGGRDATIAVIPTASQLKDTGGRYEKLFRDLGAGRVLCMPLQTRARCEEEAAAAPLDDATGVFMTGGNQLRLSTTLGGTTFARALRRANAEGVHVAGTSAGAAFLPEHMIAFGKSGSSPRADMVALAPGLGLTNAMVIDQHFRQRDRLGRLLAALAFNPFALGLGLDEDTAAFIGPDDVFEVVGSGGITVVDPSTLEYSSMDRVGQRDPVCLIGLRLHILVHGATYDIPRRAAFPPAAHAEIS
jgi:cyanophycinase